MECTVYINSLLVSLNSRNTIREAGEPTNNLSFNVPLSAMFSSGEASETVQQISVDVEQLRPSFREDTSTAAETATPVKEETFVYAL